MARFYRRKRFARRLRRAFRGKKTSMARIKKDIMKCNFPTKVKFMGLTEKKVMFLTKTFDINLTNDNVDNHTDTHEIILDPMNTSNAASLYARVRENILNWDKICILGIYIKFQPKKNMWDGQHGDISPVKCTYNMNVVPLTLAGANAYDNTSLNYKQIFTFNSNESFTMYIPAPTTMSSTDPCVHRSKTWWALANIQAHAVAGDNTPSTGKRIEEEDNNVSEDENSDEDVPQYDLAPGDANNPYIHAGRLFLQSNAASYSITINYKVALKG